MHVVTDRLVTTLFVRMWKRALEYRLQGAVCLFGACKQQTDRQQVGKSYQSALIVVVANRPSGAGGKRDQFRR